MFVTFACFILLKLLSLYYVYFDKHIHIKQLNLKQTKYACFIMFLWLGTLLISLTTQGVKTTK